MKSLQSKIYELNEGGFYKNASGMVRPSTKEELRNEILVRLDRGQTNLNDIDTSKITDMNCLFCVFEAYNLSKIDISKWDVSNVVEMSNMFEGCENFNSDLSRWNVSKVEYMDGMFCGCINFNSDLSKWNVGRVRNMEGMFTNCTNFNSDLSKWNVSRVEYMLDMFLNCTKFNCNLSKWDVSNVNDMTNIFRRSGMKELPDWYKNHKYGY